MNAQEFEKIFDNQMNYCRRLLVSKATEYASADRLSAFKEAAAIQDLSPRQALAGMSCMRLLRGFYLIQQPFQSLL